MIALRDDKEAMEALANVMDKAGLPDLLAALAEICAEKADSADYYDRRYLTYQAWGLYQLAYGRGVLVPVGNGVPEVIAN